MIQGFKAVRLEKRRTGMYGVKQKAVFRICFSSPFVYVEKVQPLKNTIALSVSCLTLFLAKDLGIYCRHTALENTTVVNESIENGMQNCSETGLLKQQISGWKQHRILLMNIRGEVNEAIC